MKRQVIFAASHRALPPPMSTKSTLVYGKTFRLYEELLERNSARLA